MKIRYNFDIKGVYTLVGVLSLGFIMMFLPLMISGSVVKLAIGILGVVVLLVIVGLGFAKGTYALIDSDSNVFRTSGFFISRSIPLSNIVSLNSQGSFAGIMTEVRLTYRENDGALKTMTTMHKQSFKKGDFKKFLEALRAANPKIDISEELLK